ncbi:NUDIX hydrolase [archaeon]|jgi:8-oxo-dGTP diphosphatase|nr:NUDIX hydrolase [archaeon]MBT6762415.1 NUDIX hydrolase [archaeon]
MAHMKTKIGEYAIITNSKNEFLMLEMLGEDRGWHFPGGRLDKGEEAVHGLLREVKEETNLEITDIKPVFCKIFTRENKYGVWFTAKVKEPYKVKLDHEHENFKWFKIEDIDSIDFWQDFYCQMLKDNL